MEIYVEPTTPQLRREQFCTDERRYGVALDGYVYGAPWFDPSGPWVNFNHHEEVDRLATRSTCAQTHLGLRRGLFHPRGVWVSDCDEDVCTSLYLLRNIPLVRGIINPRVNRLVFLEDMLDCTAGTYPIPSDLPVMEELAWVYDPYRRFRVTGGLGRKVAAEYRAVIEDVCLRIQAHVLGNGGRQALDTRFTRLGGGPGWVMAKEVGAQAKTGFMTEGMSAYVSVRERESGTTDFTIGRTEFGSLDILKALKLLNEAEGTVGNPDCWGGGNTVGGSPKVAGSRLRPQDVGDIVGGLMA